MVEFILLIPHKEIPTLKVVGPIIRSQMQTQKQLDHLDSQEESPLVLPASESRHVNKNVADTKEDSVGRRRTSGPKMPSAELLAAAAKLTAAEVELREAELDGNSELFIGPPPPAMVKEAESTNEAELLRRYRKLSLMVHPDKCSHPSSYQAFVKLNKAFKDLQDPDKAQLKVMRKAAQWRRLQGIVGTRSSSSSSSSCGISMEGDDILWVELDVKVAPKRGEWTTTLPPERKHSTKFSESSKGRGGTSVWTDTPSERAQKAKMNYLEAYNEAAALASNEQEPRIMSSEAELVDQYNKAKRSKSLEEKHQEASTKSRVKKRSKQESVKQELEGSHPWNPWDREKDLTAGRQSVNLDHENMTQGLSSRFSSGSFQRNFL